MTPCGRAKPFAVTSRPPMEEPRIGRDTIATVCEAARRIVVASAGLPSTTRISGHRKGVILAAGRPLLWTLPPPSQKSLAKWPISAAPPKTVRRWRLVDRGRNATLVSGPEKVTVLRKFCGPLRSTRYERRRNAMDKPSAIMDQSASTVTGQTSPMHFRPRCAGASRRRTDAAVSLPTNVVLAGADRRGGWLF